MRFACESAGLVLFTLINQPIDLMLFTKNSLITVVLLAVVDLAPAVAQQKSPAAVSGQLFVQFAEGGLAFTGGKTGNDAFDLKATKYSVTAIRKAFPSLDVIATHRSLSSAAESLRRVYVVRYASSHAPELVAKDLSRIRGVGFAEPIYEMELFGPSSPDDKTVLVAPDDPLYEKQTHLGRMELPAAWDVVKGQDSTAVMAIVDGGTDWRHEDLMANVWTNPDEVPDNGLDDDNNGFVDDMHGWNFSENKPDPSGETSDIAGWHGTAVASVAAGVTDNGIGLAGSSWNARFMGINAACTGQPFLCFAEKGIVYAGMNGADVINASFGLATSTEVMRLAVQTATDEGALVIAGSGNDGISSDELLYYPAGYPITLSVGGIFKDSDRNRYNYGPVINVYAPGTTIEAIAPLGPIDYRTVYGTSFSAPLVAGMAALVKTAFPSFGPHQLREQIRLTAVSIDSANPDLAGMLGSGKVDAYAAVTVAPLPGIRVLEWSHENQEEKSEVNTGDSVALRVTFKNYHGAGEGLAVAFETREPWLQWSTSQVDLGSMAHGDEQVAVFAFTVAEDAPADYSLRLAPKITGDSFEDSSDQLTLPVNVPGVANHATPALSVSITDEGNVGHTSFKGVRESRGVGFVAVGNDGSTRDLLFEGGLLIARTPSHVSDCVRQQESYLDDQEKDFVRKEGEAMVVEPGDRTSEYGRIVITDSQASSPIGVEVLQESFVDDAPMNEDFMILQYTITNTSGTEIQDMHVGLFFDWNVEPNTNDVAGFDVTRKVGFIMDRATNPNYVAGTRLLTSHHGLHYAAIDNAATIYRGFGEDGFTPSEKWALLTGGIRNNGLMPGDAKDLSQMTAAGPIRLAPEASVEVAFAMIAGTGESDFLANADQAQALYDAVIVNAEDDIQPAIGWEVHVPYPHPAVFPLELRFDTPVDSGVKLDVYDVLGRRVHRVLDSRRSAGHHVVAWDGRDEAGGRVASGLYLVRMTAKSGNHSYVNTRPIMVVR